MYYRFIPRSNDSTSKTVPDRSYTVTDLLKRFTTGQVPPTIHHPGDLGSEDADFDSASPMEQPYMDAADAYRLQSQMRTPAEIRRDLAALQKQAKKKPANVAKEVVEEQPIPEPAKAAETSN